MSRSVAQTLAAAQGLAAARTFVAFDLGLKRTGVAVAALLQEWQPEALIVGRPCHPDGNAHDMTRSAEKFARQLAQQFALPVAMIDERYTSTEAESLGAADVDSMAACLILDRYLSASALPIFL